MIQLHNVTLAYQQDASALNNINLKVGKGEFVFLTGPSGAGKTTLLRLLYGALTPTRGQVLIDGQNISRMTASQIPTPAPVDRRCFSGFQAAAKPHRV